MDYTAFLSLEPVKNYIKNKDRIIRDYNLDSESHFNFFESISDQYKKENLHSDILKTILNPYTRDIGNRNYLNYFLEFIDDKHENLVALFHDSKSIYVERETARIDILIYDEHKNAIIIENKINGAIDQKNQLPRYIEKVKNRELYLKKIVYLTLNGNKEVDKNYTDKYKKYLSDVEKFTVKISAVNKNKNDLVHNFLQRCIDFTKSERSKVFLKEYQGLLKHIGGQILMEKENAEFIKNIYSDKELIHSIKGLEKLLKFSNTNDSKITEYLGDALIEVMISDKKFELKKEGSYAVKSLDEDISLVIYRDSANICYGFYSENNKLKSKKYIIKIIDDDKLDKLSSGKLNQKDEYYYSKAWAVRSLDIDKINNDLITFDKIEKEIKKKFSILEKNFSALQDNE